MLEKNLSYLNLISAIIEQAKEDIKEDNEFSKDAFVFLECSWGNYLKDSLNLQKCNEKND